MFYEESRWLERMLAGLRLSPGELVIDVGSSDLKFRTEQQPYIYEHVDRPLLAAGVRLVRADAKPAKGVDLILDLTLPSSELPAELAQGARVVLCTNMLEHVTDREAVARRLVPLLGERGVLVVTVPRRYPEHADPIDTLYRPRPAEIEALFSKIGSGLAVMEKRVLWIRHLRHYTKRTRRRRFFPWLAWQLSAVVFCRK